MNENEGVLILEEAESDYKLKDDAIGCWITVKGMSVHIRKTDEGVVVDIYKLGAEADDSLATTYALDSEAA
jgi:hypothetical protein